MLCPNKNSVAESSVKRETTSYKANFGYTYQVGKHCTYLEIDSASLLETSFHFSNRIVCMAIKDIKVGDSIFSEKRAGNATVKSARDVVVVN